MQAVEVAKTAAKSIADMQNVAEDSETSKEDDMEDLQLKEKMKMRMTSGVRLLWINWEG